MKDLFLLFTYLFTSCAGATGLPTTPVFNAQACIDGTIHNTASTSVNLKGAGYAEQSAVSGAGYHASLAQSVNPVTGSFQTHMNMNQTAYATGASTSDLKGNATGTAQYNANVHGHVDGTQVKNVPGIGKVYQHGVIREQVGVSGYGDASSAVQTRGALNSLGTLTQLNGVTALGVQDLKLSGTEGMATGAGTGYGHSNVSFTGKAGN